MNAIWVVLGIIGAVWMSMALQELVTGGSNWLAKLALRLAARAMRGCDEEHRELRLEEWAAELQALRTDGLPIFASLRAMTFALGAVWAARTIEARHPAAGSIAPPQLLFLSHHNDHRMDMHGMSITRLTGPEFHVTIGVETFFVPADVPEGRVVVARSGAKFRILKNQHSSIVVERLD